MIKLDEIRKPEKISRSKALTNTVLLLLAGLLSGVLVKYLDIYTENLGVLFSRMSVWIVICTLIAVKSASPKRAAVNVFLYCVGMIATYYLVAELTDSVYGMSFVYGWCVFTVFTPIMGFVVWYARGAHRVSRLLKIALVVMTFVIAALMFRVTAFEILAAVLLLFITRQKRAAA